MVCTCAISCSPAASSALLNAALSRRHVPMCASIAEKPSAFCARRARVARRGTSKRRAGGVSEERACKRARKAAVWLAAASLAGEAEELASRHGSAWDLFQEGTLFPSAVYVAM